MKDKFSHLIRYSQKNLLICNKAYVLLLWLKSLRFTYKKIFFLRKPMEFHTNERQKRFCQKFTIE